MIKTLVILRHGKSTWDYLSVTDVDRPLKENGINNTLLIASKLKENKIFPQRIITSHANRALHTALIVARELNFPFSEIEIEPFLYHDSEEEIVQYLYQIENNINSIFLFGHNPTFTYLSNLFLTNKIENLPTSGTVIIQFDCQNWSEISIRTKTAETFIFPKSVNSD
jgi:phosphohistidine phosphatase